jgi:hypothetical protein
MSVVSASFWHATGAVSSPPPGLVSSQPPKPVSSAVHTYEDQHDYQNDDQQKQPSAGEVNRMRCDDRDTSHHYLASAE